MAYMSEAEKVRELPNVMKYITGKILDVGSGGSKIVPEAIGIDGRPMPGVDIVCEELDSMEIVWHAVRSRVGHFWSEFDTVFSSHFLEHVPNPYEVVSCWAVMIKSGGHLVLYLPDRRHYNNHQNLEHMQDIQYEDFMFWFRRCFCGEGKTFKGEPTLKRFEVVEEGMHVGDDKYSFYLVARHV